MDKTSKFLYLFLFTGIIFFFTVRVNAQTTNQDNVSLDTLLYLYNGNKHNKELDRIISDTRINIGSLNPKWTGIYKHNEKFIIPVIFFQPSNYVNNFEINIYTYYTRELLKSIQIKPVWQNNLPYIYWLDMSKFPDGVYRIKAEDDIGELIPFKSVEKLVAHKPVEKAGAHINIPADILSYKDLFVSKTHLVFFTPVIKTLNGRKRWNDIINFIDRFHRSSKEMEFNIPWALIEPLPGIYNFSETNRILTFAKRRGFKVSFWFNASVYPGWLYKENGHKNPLKNKIIRNYLKDAIRHFTEECASNPAFQIYFLSFKNMQGKISEGKKLESNADSIMKTYIVPFDIHQIKFYKQKNLQAGKNSDDFYKSMIETIRSIDKKRPIAIYGAFDPETSIWMNNHGVFHGCFSLP